MELRFRSPSNFAPGASDADVAAGDARDEIAQRARRNGGARAARREMLLHGRLNDGSLWLLCGRAREVLVRPGHPAPHLLVFGELLIGLLYGTLRIGRVAHQQRGARLGVAALVQTDHDTVANLRLQAQRGFQIFGIDVHPLAGDDDVLLAPLKVEIALGVELADVAGAKPTFLVQHRLQLFALPVAGGDVRATHQDLAVFVELHLPAFEHLADRALAGAEGMVQRDERGGFGEAVALNDDEAEAPPELFGFGVQRRTAGDERPELPAEAVVNLPEAPPAADEVLIFRGGEADVGTIRVSHRLRRRVRSCPSATPSGAAQPRRPIRALS